MTVVMEPICFSFSSVQVFLFPYILSSIRVCSVTQRPSICLELGIVKGFIGFLVVWLFYGERRQCVMGSAGKSHVSCEVHNRLLR